ncbi:helix-turn-helix domain-containing protein [bacterium]|nr:helix-turn-helix domain-containing protein [bacterium]
MLNFYEAVRRNPGIKKLEIGDFLFAEYACGIGDEKVPLWVQKDYLVHVLTGRKTWHTSEGIYVANPGDTVFFRKGAAIIEQHLEVEFCLFNFFVSDELIRSTVRETAGSLNRLPPAVSPIGTALRVENDLILGAFFQSMRAYISGNERPAESLLRLKLKELILSILMSGKNPTLAAYFQFVAAADAPSVADIMQANFRFNLSLEEFARLCHRSLSSFKREFEKHFQQSPGKWLLQQRLDYAATLLRSSTLNVTEIALESGFEDVSHFSRVFKERFGDSPATYREKVMVQV